MGRDVTGKDRLVKISANQNKMSAFNAKNQVKTKDDDQKPVWWWMKAGNKDVREGSRRLRMAGA